MNYRAPVCFYCADFSLKKNPLGFSGVLPLFLFIFPPSSASAKVRDLHVNTAGMCFVIVNRRINVNLLPHFALHKQAILTLVLICR